METLVAEWEKKYLLVQNDLHGLQHQLSDTQQWKESQDNAGFDLEQQRLDLENRLTEARIQLEDYRNNQDNQKNNIDEWEKKYNELSSRYNIVQLQFADTQRIKSHLESDMKKMTDYQNKYQTEVKVWQKRLTEMESDFNDQLAILKSQNQKQNKKSTIIPTSPGIPLQSDLSADQIKVINPPTVIKIKKSENKKPIIIPPPIPIVDYKLASTVLTKKVVPNDHKIIEGIGPKISNLLKRNKISTWQMLSQSPVKNIQAILDKRGTKFSLANPKTWPTQARLAVQGKWAELKKFQDVLILNKPKRVKTKLKALTPKIKTDPVKKKNIKPKVSAKPKPVRINLISSKKIFGKELRLNDLKVIEGIGPKIERLLKKVKILTWSDLAQTKLRPLRAILKKAGNNFNLADPKTWAAQARLASKGQWRRLITLQDKLNAGK